MNTGNNRRPISTAFALTTAASVITVLTVGSPTVSIASEPRGGLVQSDTSRTGSYADPLTALGGQSLAAYVSDHWAQVIVAGV